MSIPDKVSNDHQEFKDSFFIFSTIYICIGYNKYAFNEELINENLEIF